MFDQVSEYAKFWAVWLSELDLEKEATRGDDSTVCGWSNRPTAPMVDWR